ncbi:magnetosome protein MamC [Shewanella fidelis]|uniref:magnetosome protein MamC n=1 Tax=Shewanella fidelis TaxID=173509 RepID=UPI0004912CB0|nr:magnetosome protein MamC [Shewanella fidelis]
MSNSSNLLCPASRASLVGAMVGGGAAVATRWQSYKEGELAINELVWHSTKSALQAAAISGITTYAAEKMAGRSALSLMTILAAGAASLYLVDQLSERNPHE